MTETASPAAGRPKFPATFWTANTIEIFERAAYYAMANPIMIVSFQLLITRLVRRWTPLKQGRPVDTVPMWLVIAGIGVVSILGLAVYDRLIRPKTKEEGAA